MTLCPARAGGPRPSAVVPPVASPGRRGARPPHPPASARIGGAGPADRHRRAGRVVAWGDGRRPRARDDRAPPAPGAGQHGQPTGQRAPGAGAARRPAGRRGLRGRPAGPHRGTPEPGGAPARGGRRADAVPALARRHRPRRCRRVAARPVVGRRRRRRALGPWRAGHEVPDRGRGDRRGGARARGLAPRARRPARRLRRRRGDRRRRGRDVAHRAPPRRRAVRHAAQRGRRDRLPLRRRARLRRVRGREGRLSLHGDHRRGGGARLDAEDGRQRAAEDGPFLQAMGERQPPYDVTETPRALLAALGLPLDGDPARCSTRCARATPSSR